MNFLNPSNSACGDGIRAALKELAGALDERNIERSRVESAVERLGDLQRPFMARTERPREAQVKREKLQRTFGKLIFRRSRCP